MRTMHLFAGAGGGLLADLILDHQPIVAVEWDAHCCNVLRERTREGWFPRLHVHQGDVREFDSSPWAGRVDCLAAGFPCQDVSAAGRGAGIAGERSGLVWEVFRAIDVVRPSLVWLENSPRIRTKGRRDIIAALVARGYSWRDGTLAASDVGAGHERKRWWLLAANADGMRQLEQERRKREQRGWVGDSAQTPPDSMRTGLEELRWCRPDRSGQKETSDRSEVPTADALRHRLQVAVRRGGLSAADAETIEAAARYVGAYDWSPPDAGVCRVVDGLASRMDRIKCAGNGQVPLQAAAAWLALTREAT
ncbi:hypothetical protein GPA19_05270 [Azoarcus indigens]|uniref:DNA (cytosine-5-)-methyltransferase n=1 Tax=Azoarcus indigens TaxID=29545 RepID=A0A4R6DVK6_9RHOO|nr:DNA cytosine methyltransferase [Azoarcus indigens]NMG64355.1 hypothetical protein [Azoarcus indigens]TDN49193.1 DNA (cytosine-5)-methyltransferase 1 [Azoarcus indigens]